MTIIIMKKVALITGINGQDGSFLAELLLEKGYDVHGMIRRSSNFNTSRIDGIFSQLTLHYGDVSDMGNVMAIISKICPDEIYNMAAMSHVKVSFELENYTFQVNTMGILNILESIRILSREKQVKVYQASTSEMYGNTCGDGRLNEESEMRPVSPYGISKLAAHHLCNYYRNAYDMFVVSSILLNHESERRGPTFVTKKIVDYVGKYHLKQTTEPLQLGNLDSKRDWGYAGDYVYGIWLMMQHHSPDDYVLATEETHSVREFVELAFKEIGIEIEWEYQYGRNKKTGDIIVQVNERYYRPIDIQTLIGDATKAKKVLGWRSLMTFPNLVKRMVQDSIKQKTDISKS